MLESSFVCFRTRGRKFSGDPVAKTILHNSTCAQTSIDDLVCADSDSDLI